MEPFTISVPDAKIDLLRQKLALASFPDELDESGWDYGSPLADIKRLAKAWEQWDWRQAEARLNKLPQFHTDIEVDGFPPLDIHFIHQKSAIANAIPLLFVHGWPGSYLEVTKLLELSEASPAFHIVAPSLPNFGWSQGVKQKSFSGPQYAETVHKLMLKLGYNQYVTQGGDWGFWITRTVGKLYPEHCKASHINYMNAFAPTWSSPLLKLQSLLPYTPDEKVGDERSKWFDKEGMGYNILQRTKPQTIGYALADSPVALLAWIYEKLHDWTDSYPWTDDEIFTWISIYAFSRAGPAAAQRIYYEVAHDKAFPYARVKEYNGKVKLGLTFSPREIESPPRAWAKTLGNVVYISQNKDGGHFLAHEKPQYIIRDLKKMFGKGGPVYNIIPGHSGYDRANL